MDKRQVPEKKNMFQIIGGNLHPNIYFPGKHRSPWFFPKVLWLGPQGHKSPQKLSLYARIFHHPYSPYCTSPNDSLERHASVKTSS